MSAPKDFRTWEQIQAEDLTLCAKEGKRDAAGCAARCLHFAEQCEQLEAVRKWANSMTGYAYTHSAIAGAFDALWAILNPPESKETE